MEREEGGGGGGSEEEGIGGVGGGLTGLMGGRGRKRRATSGLSAGKMEWRRKEQLSMRNCCVSVRFEHWRRKLAVGSAIFFFFFF